MNKQTSARLIANTLPCRGKDFEPIRRDLGSAGVPKHTHSVTKSDPFAIQARTIDQVVDCLLKELSW